MSRGPVARPGAALPVRFDSAFEEAAEKNDREFGIIKSDPQPKATAEELCAALVRIAPSQVAAFDADRTKAMAAAREHVDAAPMRRFLRQWALTVAIERHPARAARLRELEARAAQVENLAEARAIAAEVSAIRTEALDEAGIDRRAGG